MPTDFDAEADVFFRGQPDGGWINVNQSWQTIPSNLGRGLGVVVGQLDGQTGIDVFVTNDMTSNHYWSVLRAEPFAMQETGTIRGLALDKRSRPQASMGIAADDLDADGDLDLFVTNFDEEYNTLYEQDSAGIWEDQSRARDLVDSSFFSAWLRGSGR